MYPAFAKTESKLRRSEYLRLRALLQVKCVCPCSRHTDSRTLRQRNAVGSGQVRKRDLRSERFWKRIRRGLRFYRAHVAALESVRESLREFLVWDRHGRFRALRTIAPLVPNSQKLSVRCRVASSRHARPFSWGLRPGTCGPGSPAANDRKCVRFLLISRTELYLVPCYCPTLFGRAVCNFRGRW